MHGREESKVRGMLSKLIDEYHHLHALLTKSVAEDDQERIRQIDRDLSATVERIEEFEVDSLSDARQKLEFLVDIASNDLELMGAQAGKFKQAILVLFDRVAMLPKD